MVETRSYKSYFQIPKPTLISNLKVNSFQSPCTPLLPQLGLTNDGDLTEVAYDQTQPPRGGQALHLLPISVGQLSMVVDAIFKGYEDYSLSVPTPK